MKVVVDSAFFDLSDSRAQGLISSLKKLSLKGVEIEVPDADAVNKGTLSKILKLEGINISGLNEEPASYLITPDAGDKKEGIKKIIVKTDGPVKSFEEAALQVLAKMRTAALSRKTKETEILVDVALDGQGRSSIDTGVGFFDHMLDQIARHSNIDLSLTVRGDLFVDEHHTVEDAGITLGAALLEALGDKKGIKRYGFFLPMDETIAKCAIDLGGRTYLNFKCKFKREKVGNFPTELTLEFFRGLAAGLKANIYLRAKGKNDHHKIEALFKAFAKALNEALRLDERNENRLPTTKGML